MAAIRMRSGGGDPGPPARAQAVLHRVDPPAGVGAPFRPDVPQLRHHLLREELGGVTGLVVRHVADVEEAEDVTDAQPVDRLLELLADALRAPRHHEAVVHELLPRDVLKDALRLLRELRERTVLAVSYTHLTLPTSDL